MAKYYNFVLDNGLLYNTRTHTRRLCVPREFNKQLFEQVHNDKGHTGFNKAYTMLSAEFFMPQVKKGLLDYIQKCPTCAMSKKPRHKLYGELQIVQQPTDVLQVLCLDFITGLPESQTFNALLTVTDKMSKTVRLIPSKETWTAMEWADAFFAQVLKDWGLLRTIVSDRDPKFCSTFWKQLFNRCWVRLSMTTAFNPHSDGQSEKTNDTVETVENSLIEK